eukprot:CAMPEP_0204652402 /NCGR_PEP_ID=MMETSP0718-20130828/14530_1 /ASSEMBLY_ACC=CAM_ASM_000674 /TAXON_ID=230516 /ORGANISM="Chaetoceros curvisetus" /LENGTH=120 /DNA_ID=CAMNT_0051676357 /DNA_START=1047 /DNA_END=1409 /DNA_ORIENTATION=-
MGNTLFGSPGTAAYIIEPTRAPIGTLTKIFCSSEGEIMVATSASASAFDFAGFEVEGVPVRALLLVGPEFSNRTMNVEPGLTQFSGILACTTLPVEGSGWGTSIVCPGLDPEGTATFTSK